MTFFLKYDVVSPKKNWGHLQTPLFTYKITYLAPLCTPEKNYTYQNHIWTTTFVTKKILCNPPY